MRVIVLVLQTFVIVYVSLCAGCGPAPAQKDQLPEIEQGFDIAIYTDYAPVKVEILPLTEFVSLDNPDTSPQINVYVALYDSFGCQEKSSAVFRFELYERVQRSAEPRGKRIAIWPDFDLTQAEKNNTYWRDFLRAYEINLDFQPETDHNYILQVTCLCPMDKRISAEYSLK
jgi:hypothetical protein